MFPVADSVLNAPVDGVVAPIAVEFRPVEVKVPASVVLLITKEIGSLFTVRIKAVVAVPGPYEELFA